MGGEERGGEGRRGDGRGGRGEGRGGEGRGGKGRGGEGMGGEERGEVEGPVHCFQLAPHRLTRNPLVELTETPSSSIKPISRHLVTERE